jgi:hypothetical protein
MIDELPRHKYPGNGSRLWETASKATERRRPLVVPVAMIGGTAVACF